MRISALIRKQFVFISIDLSPVEDTHERDHQENYKQIQKVLCLFDLSLLYFKYARPAGHALCSRRADLS